MLTPTDALKNANAALIAAKNKKAVDAAAPVVDTVVVAADDVAVCDAQTGLDVAAQAVIAARVVADAAEAAREADDAELNAVYDARVVAAAAEAARAVGWLIAREADDAKLNEVNHVESRYIRPAFITI